MAKFCANCGSALNDEDKVCGNCGTPVPGAAPVATPVAPAATGVTETPAEKKGSNKIIKIIVGALIAIVAIVIVSNIVGKFTGYEATVSKMVKAFQKYDMDTMNTLASSVSEAVNGIWYGDLEKYYDDRVSSALDTIEDSVGNIKKMKYEIMDVSELSKRKMKDLKETLEETFDMDADDIKKVLKVDMKLTVKGSKATDDFYVYDLLLIKEKGGWKLFYGSLSY